MNNNPFAALGALRDSLPEDNSTSTSTNENKSAEKPTKAARHTVTLFYEKKGRAGKEATIIECDNTMTDDEVSQLAADLKRSLGTGGSVRHPEILLQGDRRNKLREILTKKGFNVKG